MKFLIRDDDLSFFTESRLIDEKYEDILKDAKITFTVIPFVNGQAFYYGNQKNNIKKIAENKKLVKKIKQLLKEEKIEISIHGFNHKNLKNQKAEFQLKNKKIIKNKVLKAKKELEKTFNSNIKFFAPPHNSISYEGLQILNELKINYLGAFNIYPLKIFTDYYYFKIIIKLIWFKIVHPKKTYFKELKYKNIILILPHTITPYTTEKKFKNIKKSLK